MASTPYQLNSGAYFDNIAATTATFQLGGGLYGVSVIGASFGTVTLQRLSRDGSTYVTAMTAFSAAGYATASLPPGTYRVAIGSTTGVYVEIIGIAAGV